MKSVFLPSRRRRAAMMRRFHYLELCRLFVARHFKVALTRVQSPAIAQAVHEGLEIYFHQPDLYWVMENKLSRYVHIAQVHWSEWYSQCVSLPQVLLVKKMQESIAAHGAVLISNRRFSAPAIAAAEDQGVALVRVRPAFDIYQCHIPRASCLQALQKLEKKMPLYQAEVLPLHVPAYGRVFAYRKEKPMTSQQYEELCRHFIAEQLRLPLAEVLSVCFPSKERVYPEPGRSLRPYAHQIDLYWQTRAGSVVYVNIANAKWRGQGDKLHLHDVLLLEKVKLDVGAHKAVLITNNGFTANATRAALENGIGLLVVRPEVAQTDWRPPTARRFKRASRSWSAPASPCIRSPWNRRPMGRRLRHARRSAAWWRLRRGRCGQPLAARQTPLGRRRPRHRRHPAAAWAAIVHGRGRGLDFDGNEFLAWAIFILDLCCLSVHNDLPNRASRDKYEAARPSASRSY